MQEVLYQIFHDIMNVPLNASISFPGSSLYLFPMVLPQPPSQCPLSTSFPGSSLYLLPRVLSLPPSQGPLFTSFPRSSLYSFSGSSFYLLPRGLSLPPSQILPCIRLARRKFELTNQDSAGGKNFSSDGIGNQIVKSENYETFFCLQDSNLSFDFKILIWCQKRVACARYGNSLVVRHEFPGRIIVELF